MNLSQYEKFFSKHFDPEVKARGTFLIALINQLQGELLVHQEWSTRPVIQSRTRMQEMKLRTVIHALDRSGGIKVDACKWLGISRQCMYVILRQWNKVKPKFTHENKTSPDSNSPTSPNSLPNNQAAIPRK